MPWFKKPSDGVYWSDLHQLGSIYVFHIYRIWNKARVSQADNKLASIKVDLETKLALDLQYTRTQIENSIVSINNQKRCKASTEVFNTNNNYIQGLASLTDLLEAESELVVAKTIIPQRY
jgi:hypothetical protein